MGDAFDVIRTAENVSDVLTDPAAYPNTDALGKAIAQILVNEVGAAFTPDEVRDLGRTLLRGARPETIRKLQAMVREKGVPTVSQPPADVSLDPADYPGETDVRSGIVYNNGVDTGNLTLPTASQVKAPVQYGGAGVEFTGNRTDPPVGKVHTGIQYGASGTEFTGTVTLPPEGDVRFGEQYGAGGTEFTGNVVLPAVGEVEAGVQFGASGTEFTGTFTDFELAIVSPASAGPFAGGSVPLEYTVPANNTHSGWIVRFLGTAPGSWRIDANAPDTTSGAFGIWYSAAGPNPGTLSLPAIAGPESVQAVPFSFNVPTGEIRLGRTVQFDVEP